MSNDHLRQAALAAALQSHGQGCPASDVLKSAAAFLGFLNGADAPTSTSAKTSPSTAPVTKASPPKTAAPAPGPSSTASKKPAIPSNPEPETTEADGPTAEDVGKKINELLAADKQPEALAALKKYGAKSKSTLSVEHYADFIADADKILMDA